MPVSLLILIAFQLAACVYSQPSRPELLLIPDRQRYPVSRSLLDAILLWNPEVPEIPHEFIETIQIFNYSNITERNIALQYRNLELPFKLFDVPDVTMVVNKWSDEYLLDAMKGDTKVNTITSKSNHFMYWRKSKESKDIAALRPVGRSDMSFRQWLTVAKRADVEKLTSDAPHYYFRKNDPLNKKGSTFVGQDLSLFSTKMPNFFITNVQANKGIQCRFGMRGIIAESHYDSGRNMIAVLKGTRRYILTPPESCPLLGIISDPTHPSFRHSIIDWSDTHQARAHKFGSVTAVDTVMHAGEVLYVPSYWFHYIVSLDYSIQCNSRSGTPPSQVGRDAIKACLNMESV